MLRNGNLAKIIRIVRRMLDTSLSGIANLIVWVKAGAYEPPEGLKERLNTWNGVCI